MWFQKDVLRKHLGSHKEMPDADFVQHINVSGNLAPYALIVREAVGHFYRIPHLHIHPSDTTEYLSTLGPWYTEGADENLAVIWFFEDRLNIELDEEEMRNFPPFIESWRFFFLGRKWLGMFRRLLFGSCHMYSGSDKAAKRLTSGCARTPLRVTGEPLHPHRLLSWALRCHYG